MHHAALVLEDAHLHIRYGQQRVPAAIARHWRRLHAERALVEQELASRGLKPTP